MDNLQKLQAANPHIQIHTIHEAAFRRYGSVIIELQNIGIPRHLSMMIKDDYAEFLTFEDGVLVDINAEALIENIDCDKYKDELEELREIFL